MIFYRKETNGLKKLNGVLWNQTARASNVIVSRLFALGLFNGWQREPAFRPNIIWFWSFIYWAFDWEPKRSTELDYCPRRTKQSHASPVSQAAQHYSLPWKLKPPSLPPLWNSRVFPSHRPLSFTTYQLPLFRHFTLSLFLSFHVTTSNPISVFFLFLSNPKKPHSVNPSAATNAQQKPHSIRSWKLVQSSYLNVFSILSLQHRSHDAPPKPNSPKLPTNQIMPSPFYA